MNRRFTAFVAMFVLGLVSASLVGEEKPKRHAPVEGVVKSTTVAERKVTLEITNKDEKTEAQTFVMSFDGKVILDGAFLSLADLKPGMKVHLDFDAQGEIAKISQPKAEKPKKTK